MKNIIRLLCFLPFVASAGAQTLANATIATMVDPTVSYYVTKVMYEPASSGLYWYDQSTKNPSFVTLGANCSVVAGVLNCTTPPIARAFQNPARTLNTAFQISTTRDASVNYSVEITVASALLGNVSGRAHLEYADDSGFTTNVVDISSSPNGTSGVLNLTNLGPGNVGGWIPANKYARIRTENLNGTPTFTFARSQEVLH